MSDKNKACIEMQKLLSPYMDGQLEERDMALVRQHLEDCKECYEEYRQLLATRNLVKRGMTSQRPVPDISYSVRRRLLKRRMEGEVASSEQRKKPGFFPEIGRWLRRAMAGTPAIIHAALVISLAVFVIFGSQWFMTGSGSPQMALMEDFMSLPQKDSSRAAPETATENTKEQEEDAAFDSPEVAGAAIRSSQPSSLSVPSIRPGGHLVLYAHSFQATWQEIMRKAADRGSKTERVVLHAEEGKWKAELNLLVKPADLWPLTKKIVDMDTTLVDTMSWEKRPEEQISGDVWNRMEIELHAVPRAFFLWYGLRRWLPALAAVIVAGISYWALRSR